MSTTMMRGARGLLGVALLSSAMAACAGAGASSVGRVSEADRMRSGLAGRDAQSLAPQAFALADKELSLAKEAQAAGDALAAELHADRALAAYSHAIVLARLARATEEEASANKALAKATADVGSYAAQRKAVDRKADDLEKKLRVAREASMPTASGPADPERERARTIAAQSLVTQARLLCGAARLVSPQAPGLAEADATVATLEKQIDGARSPIAIDPAARARAACLTALTKARRPAGADVDRTDALLAELSQSSDPKRAAGDLAPLRDERGVVVTLRSAFKGEKLTSEAEGNLKDLGRVAAAHPTFAVQVVVHDAQAPSPAEVAANQKRGDAVVKALLDGGAAAAKVKVEQAAARAPVVDPKDTRHRDRNARIEIVFVSGGG